MWLFQVSGINYVIYIVSEELSEFTMEDRANSCALMTRPELQPPAKKKKKESAACTCRVPVAR